MGRVVGLAVAGGLAALLVSTYVGDEERAVREVFGSSGSAELEVGIDSCNRDPRVEVEESATEVRLTALVGPDGPMAGEGDCRDGARVVLATPLGDRVVVDGATGATLPVTPPDS